jgi:hypothetical protein
VDSENFEAQIRVFATAFGHPEEAVAFERAVKFLAICFEVRPESRAIFNSVVTVDRASLAWPEELREFIGVFVGT